MCKANFRTRRVQKPSDREVGRGVHCAGCLISGPCWLIRELACESQSAAAVVLEAVQEEGSLRNALRPAASLVLVCVVASVVVL